MTTADVPLTIDGHLWINGDRHGYLGGRRIELLEAIADTGSISRGAQRIGMSYKAAWDAVDAMNNLAGRPLVIRNTGGVHGGGSALTEFGRQMVTTYRLMQREYEAFLARLRHSVDNFDNLNNLMRVIAMKTSARNQLRGQVRAVIKGAVNGDVILDLGNGLEIFANITNEAIDDLQLQPGREAAAIIKSSFVLLSPDEHLRISARNRLPGTVLTVIPGAVNSEIKMELAGGRVLTAIITNDSVQEFGFAPGTRCCALIKASHVMIAVDN